MRKDPLKDLASFVTVADELSFTRAAAKLGMSPSALSHSMRALEDHLGVRLLTRTTRSVSPTQAGYRLPETLRPAFESITAELNELSGTRNRPAGVVRITALKHAITTVIRPKLPAFLAQYPEIGVELTVDDAWTDIVADRYDAGLRWGHRIERDMIAVRVGPDLRMAVVASPAYFVDRAVPLTPQDLAAHQCINYRLKTSGGFYLWEFERDGRKINARVEGSLVFNDGDLMLDAALDGLGLTCAFEDQVIGHIKAGRLVRVLDAWCPYYSGYHLYYPSHRHVPPALAALIEALRYAPA